MIDREHDLSITKQAEVLRISRGSVYYLPRPVPDADLAIMRRLDRLHLEFPFRRFADVERPAGCRWVQDRPPACQNAHAADGDRGALSPSAHHYAGARSQDLSVSAARHGDHAAEPGLGAIDITYIPMARGFVYLAVVLIRRVLSWRLSITMEAAFCVETLDALHPVSASRTSSTPTRARPLTGQAFSPRWLKAMASAISMDGKGSWRDNVFVERLLAQHQIRGGVSAGL